MSDTWITERIASARARIEEISLERIVPEPFGMYFRKTAAFLLSVRKDADNTALYEDILPANYGNSYANPDYAADMLGADYGPYLAAVYAELRALIPAVFEDRLETQAILYELFIELYCAFEIPAADGEELPGADTVKEHFASWLRDYTAYFTRERIREMVDPEADFAARIIRGADFSGTDYLYSYGEYVSEDILKTAAFINALPEDTVRHMAHTYAEGYRLGFVHARKDLSRKMSVQLVYVLGFERMMRYAVEEFREMGLSPTILRSSPHLILKSANRRAGYTGAIPNLQFDEDHKEDLMIVLDEHFVSARKRAMKEAFEEFREKARGHAGPAVLEVFGEEAFVPETRTHALHLSETQDALFLRLRSDLMQIQQRYIPGDERSFTIIAYPLPQIGADFEAVFAETIRVNTLDTELYARIQQQLIDALDRGQAVEVRGRGTNGTDLRIALESLRNPEKESLFENCLADVNIPLGEVFTTPRLEGTCGILHVSRVFLNGFEFRDLKIRFEDGMIAESSCGNFDTEEENRAYIREHILFRHPTLPIGEFAIGTNTVAYVMGKKYGIEGKLPILIAEKTGPHFAVGDTCYSYEEDNPVYNPDGKELIARDNSCSLLRKTEPEKAYFGCHTDITIPYEELGSIRVLLPDGGSIPLIEDGRYVLPGTEELNAALDEIDGTRQ